MGIKTLGGAILHNDAGNIVNECHSSLSSSSSLTPVPVPDDCPCDATEWSNLVNNGTPCHGLVQEYRISGYSDGDLEAHAYCNNSEAPGWTGNFKATSQTFILRCVWDRNFEPAVSIDGKVLYVTYGARIYLSNGVGWIMNISCYGTDPYPPHLWDGIKSFGATPVGTYSRTGGYNLTTSLEVVEG